MQQADQGSVMAPAPPPAQRERCDLSSICIKSTGSLHESLLHECLKAYVCILYASPCAPLLVLWPGEVEGTSLAMAQGKASPVPAPEPMFRVSAVLRRYDADVPPTAVGACCGHALRPSMSVLHAVFCGGGTQHNPLSAANAKNRMRNACGGLETSVARYT